MIKCIQMSLSVTLRRKINVKKYLRMAGATIGALAFVGLAVFILLLYLFFGVLMPYYNVPNDNKAVYAYNPDSGLVSEETYTALMASEKAEKFELGINKDGKVVFVHPYKAFGRAKKEYKAVWQPIDRHADDDKLGITEKDVNHLSRTFYIQYIDLLPMFAEKNPDLATDAKVYAEILQIYANSYNKHR